MSNELDSLPVAVSYTNTFAGRRHPTNTRWFASSSAIGKFAFANDRPRRDNLHRRSIDDHDLIRVGYIHEHARPGAFELKRFRVTGELRFSENFAIGRTNACQGTTANSPQKALAVKV